MVVKLVITPACHAEAAGSSPSTPLNRRTDRAAVLVYARRAGPSPPPSACSSRLSSRARRSPDGKPTRSPRRPRPPRAGARLVAEEPRGASVRLPVPDGGQVREPERVQRPPLAPVAALIAQRGEHRTTPPALTIPARSPCAPGGGPSSPQAPRLLRAVHIERAERGVQDEHLDRVRVDDALEANSLRSATRPPRATVESESCHAGGGSRPRSAGCLRYARRRSRRRCTAARRRTPKLVAHAAEPARDGAAA